MRARSVPAALMLALSFCAHRPDPSPSTVLFLCPHGAAKSLIAATYFNQLAAEHGLLVTASAAATEEPYAEVPAPVAAVLRAEGVDVTGFQPRHVDPSDVASATRVVTIDCDPSTLPAADAKLEQWNDVPKVSEDLDGSCAAIRRHVVRLIEELRRRKV